MNQPEVSIDALFVHEAHPQRWLGLLIGLAASLVLHAVALAGCIYWMDWFGHPDGDELPRVEIIVLGNIGGSAGSVKGSPEGTNTPPATPPVAELVETKAPVPISEPVKPQLTMEDLKITMEEAQHWLSRATPQWRLPSDPLPSTLKLPDLPTKELEDSWLQAATWIADQLPKLKSTPKKEPAVTKVAEPAPAPPPALVKNQDRPKEPAKSEPKKVDVQPAPQPSAVANKQQGNSEANGNNRSGFGSKGSGGNADGIDAPARILEGSWPDPSYPSEALQMRISGSVEFLIDYDARGKVTRISILRSSGSALLDEPTLRFAQDNWQQIIPKKVKGQPSAGSVRKQVNYVIR